MLFSGNTNEEVWVRVATVDEVNEVTTDIV
jgi:hypothetical protein